MNRRGFLSGLLAAPAVITTPGLLMPVKAFDVMEPTTGHALLEILEAGRRPVSYRAVINTPRSVYLYNATAGGGVTVDRQSFMAVRGATDV